MYTRIQIAFHHEDVAHTIQYLTSKSEKRLVHIRVRFKARSVTTIRYEPDNLDMKTCQRTHVKRQKIFEKEEGEL